jgi:hypothetical protein
VASDGHLALLRQGAAIWNEWRARYPYKTDLAGADLSGADLSGAGPQRGGPAELIETIFANVDLTATKGLNACLHIGPSSIDFRTLSRSKNLPLLAG